ncbi:hypothetical protein [Geopseudomonas aromaticivorans]
MKRVAPFLIVGLLVGCSSESDTPATAAVAATPAPSASAAQAPASGFQWDGTYRIKTFRNGVNEFHTIAIRGERAHLTIESVSGTQDRDLKVVYTPDRKAMTVVNEAGVTEAAFSSSLPSARGAIIVSGFFPELKENYPDGQWGKGVFLGDGDCCAGGVPKPGIYIPTGYNLDNFTVKFGEDFDGSMNYTVNGKSEFILLDGERKENTLVLRQKDIQIDAAFNRTTTYGKPMYFDVSNPAKMVCLNCKDVIPNMPGNWILDEAFEKKAKKD